MQISGLITPGSLVFIDEAGRPYNIDGSHPNFEKIKEFFKVSQQTSTVENVKTLLEKMIRLADVSKTIQSFGEGRVTVSDGCVLFDGEQVHNTVTERILSGLDEGFNMRPYIRFLENLMQNPSKIAVNELYGFMEHGRMGISEDGFILAYKKVRSDYKDVHSGRFDNHPGQSHAMPRNQVDDNRERTCSTGFHFCSHAYLSQFGGDRVVMVKVNPRDVVSIPADYNNTKARCSAYEVMRELGDGSSDYLSSKSVFTPREYHHIDDVKEDSSVYHNQTSDKNSNPNLPRRDSRGRFIKN